MPFHSNRILGCRDVRKNVCLPSQMTEYARARKLSRQPTSFASKAQKDKTRKEDLPNLTCGQLIQIEDQRERESSKLALENKQLKFMFEAKNQC